jgi:hypothetical protein
MGHVEARIPDEEKFKMVILDPLWYFKKIIFFIFLLSSYWII